MTATVARKHTLEGDELWGYFGLPIGFGGFITVVAEALFAILRLAGWHVAIPLPAWVLWLAVSLALPTLLVVLTLGASLFIRAVPRWRRAGSKSGGASYGVDVSYMDGDWGVAFGFTISFLIGAIGLPALSVWSLGSLIADRSTTAVSSLRRRATQMLAATPRRGGACVSSADEFEQLISKILRAFELLALLLPDAELRLDATATIRDRLSGARDARELRILALAAAVDVCKAAVEATAGLPPTLRNTRAAATVVCLAVIGGLAATVSFVASIIQIAQAQLQPQMFALVALACIIGALVAGFLSARRTST